MCRCLRFPINPTLTNRSSSDEGFQLIADRRAFSAVSTANLFGSLDYRYQTDHSLRLSCGRTSFHLKIAVFTIFRADADCERLVAFFTSNLISTRASHFASRTNPSSELVRKYFSLALAPGQSTQPPILRPPLLSPVFACRAPLEETPHNEALGCYFIDYKHQRIKINYFLQKFDLSQMRPGSA